MRMYKKIYNKWLIFVNFQRKYNYVFYPIVTSIIFNIIIKIPNIITVNQSMNNNIVSVSGVLVGFLFSSHSILIALPDNKKYVQLLKEYGYLKRNFLSIFLGEIFLTISLVLSFFELNIFLSLNFFIIGICYTIILAVNLFFTSIYIVK
ncbi:hypothetical protein [Clostridium sp. BSD9I1]|uniref:hypothetical protein n=1 Tax=Clostridium sp. BSD9I1 TaxID=2003589 RepID=UPI001648AAA3|nr:hypothetical protein [Clostridium sp. BSD9I1]